MTVELESSHFQKVLDEYIDGYMRARNLAERSRVEYTFGVRQFLHFLESIHLNHIEDVESKHINAYLAELDRQNASGVTRRKKLTIIRTLFSWLYSNGEIKTNVGKHIIPPQREQKEPRVLNETEYQRLLAVVQKPRDRAIIQLLLQTGIRLSEAQHLTLMDTVVPTRITKDSLGTIRILGKGRKTRTILLNRKACEALHEWLRERPKSEINALFISTHEQPLSGRQIQRVVKKYLKLAGITGASTHTLRHTFGTHHIEAGTDLITVQEFLGHASLDTTKLYIGLAEKRKAKHIQDNAL